VLGSGASTAHSPIISCWWGGSECGRGMQELDARVVLRPLRARGCAGALYAASRTVGCVQVGKQLGHPPPTLFAAACPTRDKKAAAARVRKGGRRSSPAPLRRRTTCCGAPPDSPAATKCQMWMRAMESPGALCPPKWKNQRKHPATTVARALPPTTMPVPGRRPAQRTGALEAVPSPGAWTLDPDPAPVPQGGTLPLQTP
jgi:hypothetical protein